MFRLISVLLVSLFSIVSFAVDTSGQLLRGKMPFEDCMAAALEVRPGMVIKVEMKRENDSPVYEFDIRDNRARDWDIECNADTGEIIEIEREVTTPRHSLFQAGRKITEEEARSAATDAYPGQIIETEYEIEESGRAVFEFDIRQADNVEMKVEIDAGTGKVHEANREYWQIGYE